ncbi:hypothetical protein Tco_0116125 [Tanacetum coccineum]
MLSHNAFSKNINQLLFTPDVHLLSFSVTNLTMSSHNSFNTRKQFQRGGIDANEYNCSYPPVLLDEHVAVYKGRIVIELDVRIGHCYSVKAAAASHSFCSSLDTTIFLLLRHERDPRYDL